MTRQRSRVPFGPSMPPTMTRSPAHAAAESRSRARHATSGASVRGSRHPERVATPLTLLAGRGVLGRSRERAGVAQFGGRFCFIPVFFGGHSQWAGRRRRCRAAFEPRTVPRSGGFLERKNTDGSGKCRQPRHSSRGAHSGLEFNSGAQGCQGCERPDPVDRGSRRSPIGSVRCRARSLPSTLLRPGPRCLDTGGHRAVLPQRRARSLGSATTEPGTRSGGGRFTSTRAV